MPNRTLRLLMLPCLLVSLLSVAAACNNPFSSGDSPSEPDAIITLAGTCRASSNAGIIVCEDRSRTDPADQIKSITFTALDQGGLTVETRTADPRQRAPRQVVFSGLLTGVYSVEHIVESNTGQEARLIYRNLTVF